MSTKKLEWLFGLEDKMSGPASVAEKKLELLERRIKSVAKAEAAMSGPRKEKFTFARRAVAAYCRLTAAAPSSAPSRTRLAPAISVLKHRDGSSATPT